MAGAAMVGGRRAGGGRRASRMAITCRQACLYRGSWPEEDKRLRCTGQNLPHAQDRTPVADRGPVPQTVTISTHLSTPTPPSQQPRRPRSSDHQPQ